MKVENMPIDRYQLFSKLLLEKRILHVGCTDYPITNVNKNVHLHLASLKPALLDGMDVDIRGLEELAHHYPGRYYTSLSLCTDSYDVVLVPEVVEHVDNVRQFLEELDKINTKQYIITVPNLEGAVKMNFFRTTGDDYVEEVHPDHNCWYSPYTLSNIIKKFTKWQLLKVFTTDSQRSVGVICQK